ncbi:hypothetical protein GCM10027085_03760 [Spirosoma aerophilum]
MYLEIVSWKMIAVSIPVKDRLLKHAVVATLSDNTTQVVPIWTTGKDRNDPYTSYRDLIGWVMIWLNRDGLVQAEMHVDYWALTYLDQTRKVEI